MRISRRAAASLVAPLVFLVPVLSLFAWQVTQPVVIFEGEADDAPQRAAGAFVVALPIIYTALALVAYVMGSVLFRFKYTSLKRFTMAALFMAFGIGVVVGVVASSPGSFGWQDSLASVAAFSALFLVSTAPAAVCWWYLAKSEA